MPNCTPLRRPRSRTIETFEEFTATPKSRQRKIIPILRLLPRARPWSGGECRKTNKPVNIKLQYNHEVTRSMYAREKFGRYFLHDLHIVQCAMFGRRSTMAACTEPRKSLGTWLREISSCSCLTFLTGPAWVLLSKICKDFFSALYTYAGR